MEDTCVMCGEYVPEGRQVYITCEQTSIKDSGNRRKFETGAVRDIQEGKGRCDLLPLGVVADLIDSKELMRIHEFKTTGDPLPLFDALKEFSSIYMTRDESGDIMEYDSKSAEVADMVLEVSVHFEDGAKKYGDNNWRKGIPTHCYIDSAIRHYLKWIRDDSDEHHDRAFAWNLLCCIWTCQNKPELNDYRKDGQE